MQSLARHSKDKVPYTLTAEVQTMLHQYTWPGNVRELENVVQRALVLCSGKTITMAHLMFDEVQNQDLVINPDMPLMTESGHLTSISKMAPEKSAEDEAQVMAKAHLSNIDSEKIMSRRVDETKTFQVDFNASANKMTSNFSEFNKSANTSNESSSFNFLAGSHNKSQNLFENEFQYQNMSASSDEAINLSQAVKSSEHQVILAALQSTQSRTEAAQKLGISPRTLRYKLAQLRERGMSVAYSE